MKNDSFYKTLRIVCLILAIVCMALSLVKKAKAAPAPDYVINYYETLIDNSNIQSQQKESLMNLFNTYSNTILFEYPTSDWCILVFPHDDMGFCSRDSSTSINYIWGGVTSTDYYSSSGISTYIYSSDYEANGYYIIQYVSQYNTIYCTKYYGANIYGKDYNTYLYYGGSRVSQFGLSGYGDFPYKSSGFNKDETICYINDSTNVYTFYITQFNRSYYYYRKLTSNSSDYNNIQELPKPPSTNTDGFEVYKYGASGSERLVCDFADCISISDAVGNTSTIQINIKIDGIDQTFNFDYSSTYYDYSVPNHIAKYSFPLSIFGINNETISAKLTGVTIINTTSSPGGSGTKNITWVTPLTLVGSDYEDLEPEVIPDAPDYTLNVNNQQYYEDIENKITSEWVEDVTQSDVHNYVDGNTLICAYQRGYTWADWWNDWNGFFANVQDLPTYIFDNSPTSTDEFKEKMMDFLKNNYGSLYFDTVIITWDPRNGELPLIYVWKTNLYQLKNTNNILKDMAEDLNISAFYTKQTYFDIKARLDDFEDKSLTKLNEMVGLQELENGFISSLQSILNQILNALLNLNIEVPDADYTDILEKLDTIIENQDTSDINDDWYQNYREWLYGINENDSYLSPHEYFNNIFGTLKTTFDSFTNNISFNAYLLKVEDFINHISGSTLDNLTIYLRDGIGDPGFNINNNYMYTVGGTP